MNRQGLAGCAPATAEPRKRSLAIFRNPGSDIAAFAAVQTLCFLALAWLEPRFLVIHLYQLIPYIAILLLVAYGQRRWAYMIAPLVSTAWLGLAYMAGLLGSAVERLRAFGRASLDANLVAFLALVIAVVAVIMTVVCRIHWVKEYSGRVPGRRTFLTSLGTVVVYYAILLHWFWEMIPNG